MKIIINREENTCTLVLSSTLLMRKIGMKMTDIKISPAIRVDSLSFIEVSWLANSIKAFNGFHPLYQAWAT
jgi:hypothetical protein